VAALTSLTSLSLSLLLPAGAPLPPAYAFCLRSLPLLRRLAVGALLHVHRDVIAPDATHFTFLPHLLRLAYLAYLSGVGVPPGALPLLSALPALRSLALPRIDGDMLEALSVNTPGLTALRTRELEVGGRCGPLPPPAVLPSLLTLECDGDPRAPPWSWSASVPLRHVLPALRRLDAASPLPLAALHGAPALQELCFRVSGDTAEPLADLLAALEASGAPPALRLLQVRRRIRRAPPAMVPPQDRRPPVALAEAELSSGGVWRVRHDGGEPAASACAWGSCDGDSDDGSGGSGEFWRDLAEGPSEEPCDCVDSLDALFSGLRTANYAFSPPL